MTWLQRLFRPAPPPLAPEEVQRLEAWRAAPAASSLQRLGEGRWVVVDVETSGLNLAKDRLIAIGAVAVNDGRIDLGDSFEIILQQKAVSGRDNILIHGIGGTAQSEGVPPEEALLRFLEYLGKSPLVAFHVTFDETMIKRALKEYLGFEFKHPWVDLAYIAPALHPSLARRYRALDDWMGYFRINNYARHSALADALATAQLFLMLAGSAVKKGAGHLAALQDMEKAQRWVSWSN